MRNYTYIHPDYKDYILNLEKQKQQQAMDRDWSQAPIPKGHTQLPSKMVDDQSWDRFVGQSQKPVMVLFTMAGCSTCTTMLSTVWQALQLVYGKHWDCYQYACTPATTMDKELDVHGHPHLFFFHHGLEIGNYIGYSQYEYYQSMIKDLEKRFLS